MPDCASVSELLPRFSALRQARAKIIEAAGLQQILRFASGWGLLDKRARTWEPHKNGNRIIDYGYQGTFDTEDLSSPFAEAGLPRYFVYLDPYPGVSTARTRLAQAGHKRTFDIVVLGQTLAGDLPPVDSGVTARKVGLGDIGDVMQVLTYHGTQQPMWVDKVQGSLTEAGASVHLSYSDGVPIAVGVLNTFEGLAYLSNATTVPMFRGRGAQQALIRSRLTEAKELGCDTAVVETHKTFTTSLNNLKRYGFEELFTREIYRFEFDPLIRETLTDCDSGHAEPEFLISHPFKSNS